MGATLTLNNPTPDPDPNPKKMGHDESFEGDTKATLRGTLGSTHNKSDPKETPSSYSIGLITQHDNEIHDNDIIMNTIADSGADIDVITGQHKDTYTNITKLVNTCSDCSRRTVSNTRRRAAVAAGVAEVGEAIVIDLAS